MSRQFFRFLATLAVGLMALGSGTAVFAQNSDGSDSDAGDSKPAAKTPKVRHRVTAKLPEEYRSKDKDKDGQIGLYEWSRTDYAKFRQLDLNGDGFLTPLELSRAGRSRRSVSADVASTSERASTAATAPATADTATEVAGPAPTTGKSDAERQFDLVDKDKNGKITEEEFQKSTLTRLKFTKAGIALSFPVGRDEFLRVYPAPATEAAQ